MDKKRFNKTIEDGKQLFGIVITSYFNYGNKNKWKEMQQDIINELKEIKDSNSIVKRCYNYYGLTFEDISTLVMTIPQFAMSFLFQNHEEEKLDKKYDTFCVLVAKSTITKVSNCSLILSMTNSDKSILYPYNKFKDNIFGNTVEPYANYLTLNLFGAYLLFGEDLKDFIYFLKEPLIQGDTKFKTLLDEKIVEKYDFNKDELKINNILSYFKKVYETPFGEVMVDPKSFKLNKKYQKAFFGHNVCEPTILNDEDMKIYTDLDVVDDFIEDLKNNIQNNNKGKEYSYEHGIIINPDNIIKKELYFSDNTEKQISQVYKLLDNNNFPTIQKRLVEKGFISGVCIMLHGVPGTGKTESVLQIAKNTGRKIYKVECGTIRGNLVGDGEMNITNVFNEYETMCENEKLTPILLFNEADSFFTKRTNFSDSGISGTAAKGENTMINIILDKMENFKGIMMATTNLGEDFDKAFERRFLMKIKFEKPSIEVREKMWKNKLDTVQEDVIKEISKEFDFSGGEIDNIARKIIIDECISGETPTYETIVLACNTEKIVTPKQHRSIGFV